MADLPSTFSYVTDVEVAQNANVTESLNVKLGQNDNHLKDNIDAEIATRISADNSFNATLTVAEGQLSLLDGVPQYLTSSTVTGMPELLTSSRSVSITFVKNIAAVKTFLQLRIYGSGGFVFQSQYDLGVNPNTWTTASWYWFFIEDTIAWHLHKEFTF